jgi:hypothetical protein
VDDSGARTVAGTAIQSHVVQLFVYTRAQTEGLNFGQNHDADCSWPGPDSFVANDEIDVNWNDLRWGVTLTGDLPQPDVTPIPGTRNQIHSSLHLQLGPVIP